MVGRRLIEAVGANTILFYIFDRRKQAVEVLANPGFEPHARRRAALRGGRHLGAADPCLQPDTTRIMQELVAPDVWSRAPISNEWVRPHGIDRFWSLQLPGG